MDTDPMKQELSKTLGTIESVFTPGVVKISCGCAPERSARCLQRGRTREHDGSLNPESPLNKQCHVFVTESDLLNMAHDVIHARFLSTRMEESRATIDLNPFSEDAPDQPQPGPLKRKRARKKAKKKR